MDLVRGLNPFFFRVRCSRHSVLRRPGPEGLNPFFFRVRCSRENTPYITLARVLITSSSGCGAHGRSSR